MKISTCYVQKYLSDIVNDSSSENSDNEDNDQDYRSEDCITGNKYIYWKMMMKLSKQQHKFYYTVEPIFSNHKGPIIFSDLGRFWFR